MSQADFDELQKHLMQLGKLVADACPAGIGFAIVLFDESTPTVFLAGKGPNELMAAKLESAARRIRAGALCECAECVRSRQPYGYGYGNGNGYGYGYGNGYGDGNGTAQTNARRRRA